MSGGALPNGKYTDDDTEYGKAWQAIGKQLENAIGVRPIGYDPDVLVMAGDSNKTAELPMWLVDAILMAVNNERV